MTTLNEYHLKISLVQPFYPLTKLHRRLIITGNATLNDLHERIFEAFDRTDPHLYQYFISRSKMDSFHQLFKDCQEIACIPEITDEDFLINTDKTVYATSVSLDELDLREKSYFYYWFDFGDDWLHRIRVEKICLCHELLAEGEYVCHTDGVGISPPQYPVD